MSNEIIRAFDRVWEASERRRFQHALLGRKNPNTGLWDVNEGLAAGYVWVSMGVLGDQGVAEARNSGSGRVALRRSLPVLVREENGVLVVTGEDNAHAYLSDDADAEPNEYGVPSHPHAFLSLSDVLPTSLVDGQFFKWDATAGKLVNVAAVDSVNGQVGVVVLGSDAIAEGATNLYFSTAEETKLAGIAAGAEVNVNADWTAVSGDAMILNKPTGAGGWEPLTNGDAANPELIFSGGDVIMVEMT